MTSDRSSHRVADEIAKVQVTVPGHCDTGEDVRPYSGADGEGLLAGLHPARISRRGRTELRTRLSDRDWRLLNSLAELHYLTSRQLERLHYRAELTALSAARTVNRDLRRLQHWRLVDHLERRIGGFRAGSAAAVWTLTAGGHRLLGAASRRRSHEPSRLHLDHVLAVSELVTELAEVEQLGRIERLVIQTEPDCWRVLPAANGGRLTCKPDLRLTLDVGDEERHWFVEVDRGSEHRPVIKTKCLVYLQLWRNGQEQAEHGVFPRVLWQVPDEERQTVIGEIVRALGSAAPPGLFVTATTGHAVEALTGLSGIQTTRK